MAAEEGNKYNEKWSEEMVVDIFQKSLSELEANRTIIFLGELAVEMELYKDWYSTQYKRFPENEDLRTIKKRIDTILETRCAVGAMRRQLDSTMCIFNLKNNYGWKDKQEFYHDGTIVNITRKPAPNAEPLNDESDD